MSIKLLEPPAYNNNNKPLPTDREREREKGTRTARNDQEALMHFT